MSVLTQERLHSLLDYDAEQGILTWKVKRGHRTPGTTAGCVNPAHGYREITIDYKSYREHRLIWFYVHGLWPEECIDHINGDPSDNRLSNLREATYAQNRANTKPYGKVAPGLKGVRANHKKWTALIGINGKSKYLGSFDTAEEAHAAYCAAAAALHGEYAHFNSLEDAQR